MLTYSDLLKDPRWQRKRLEILERAGWECENCGDSESTLHVHHGYYEKGIKPWEYPEHSLCCLCESCHNAVSSGRKNINSAISKFIDRGPLDCITGYISGILIRMGMADDIPVSLFDNRDFVRGVCDFIEVEPENILDEVKTCLQSDDNGLLNGKNQDN